MISFDDKKLKFNSDDIDLFTADHPSFSIRGYVSDSRSKDIASSWPFSDKTLQTCLQNGVTKLLPPFQSLESIRSNSPYEESVSDLRGKSDVNEFKSNQDLTLTETKSKKNSLVSTKKTEIKKCRIKLKVNTSVELIKEVPPMSSKVCPVCKTFISSSNTTLNAHIDQCLSGESSMKWTASPGESSMKWTANPKVIVKQHSIKPRIKPRKMRMMVDIYKTATYCTVEELDARNGTSWANKSNFPDQELEFQEEEDEEATVNVPQVADHEGAVYIDTNGTKVRILSVPKAVSDDREAHYLLKRGKFGKTLMVKKKSKNLDLDKHQHKSLKLSPNSKKPSSEVTAGHKENVAFEQNRKEDRGKAPMKPEVRMNKDEMPIVRPPWACSKRTVLAKKLRENIHSRIDAIRNLSTTASDRSLSESGLSIPSSSSSKTGIPSQKVSQKMGTSPLGQYTKKISLKLTTPSQFKHSKGSNGSKLSSLLSVNKEPAAKINLKRKFTALTGSCVGPSQDSLEQQSPVEKGTSENLSSESMNLLEVRMNDQTKIFTPETSAASLSSNGDPSCDIESASIEALSHKEQISTMHVPRENGVAGSSMNLSNSEEGNDDKDTYCAYSVNESMRINDLTDYIKMKKNYFHVDPIQVPEPQVSFFSSLGAEMVTEEHHMNSSVVDQDSMSDSPISTISNPTLLRSDSDKFYVRSCSSLKDDTTREMVDAMNEKYAANSGDWRSLYANGFKNDHQPCCCSRKEGVSSQSAASSYQESTLLRKNAIEFFNFKPQMFSVSSSSQPPTLPPPPLAENLAYLHTPISPLKPVLRLMGKNLTVDKTDEDARSPHQIRFPHPQVSPIGRFPFVQNDNNYFNLGYHHQYQNGYQSPNNMTNHGLDTIFRSNSYTDYGSPHVGPMIPEARNMHAPPSSPIKEVIIIDDSPEEETRNWPSSHSSIPPHNRNIHNHMPYGYESHNSLRFSNGSFQGHSPFMKVEDTRTHGSSRSSAIYYPPGFP